MLKDWRLRWQDGQMKDDDWSNSSQPGGPRGPADDGKRLGLSESALDVALPQVS